MPKIADCFLDRTTTDRRIHEQLGDEFVLKEKIFYDKMNENYSEASILQVAWNPSELQNED